MILLRISVERTQDDSNSRASPSVLFALGWIFDQTSRDPAIASPPRTHVANRLAHRSTLEGQLDHDISDLTILLEPGEEAGRANDIDPAVIADFNDAKAGPITGIPPRP